MEFGMNTRMGEKVAAKANYKQYDGLGLFTGFEYFYHDQPQNLLDFSLERKSKNKAKSFGYGHKRKRKRLPPVLFAIAEPLAVRLKNETGNEM